MDPKINHLYCRNEIQRNPIVEAKELRRIPWLRKTQIMQDSHEKNLARFWQKMQNFQESDRKVTLARIFQDSCKICITGETSCKILNAMKCSLPR